MLAPLKYRSSLPLSPQYVTVVALSAASTTADRFIMHTSEVIGNPTADSPLVLSIRDSTNQQRASVRRWSQLSSGARRSAVARAPQRRQQRPRRSAPASRPAASPARNSPPAAAH